MKKLLLRPAWGFLLMALAVTAAAATSRTHVTLVRWPYT